MCKNARTNIITEPREQLLRWAVSDFLGYLNNRGVTQTVVALPGGNSIVGFLQELSKAVLAKQLQVLNHVVWFQTDEFEASAERPETNWDVLHRHFFQDLLSAGLIAETAVERMPVGVGFCSYESTLMKYGGKFDVVFLSGGGGKFPNGEEDLGHCAAIFPGDEAIWESERLFTRVDNAPKPPQVRYTATPRLLLQAQLAYGFLFGAERQATLQAYGDGVSHRKCPIGLITDVPRSFLLTDIGC